MIVSRRVHLPGRRRRRCSGRVSPTGPPPASRPFPVFCHLSWQMDEAPGSIFIVKKFLRWEGGGCVLPITINPSVRTPSRTWFLPGSGSGSPVVVPPGRRGGGQHRLPDDPGVHMPQKGRERRAHPTRKRLGIPTPFDDAANFDSIFSSIVPAIFFSGGDYDMIYDMIKIGERNGFCVIV